MTSLPPIDGESGNFLSTDGSKLLWTESNLQKYKYINNDYSAKINEYLQIDSSLKNIIITLPETLENYSIISVEDFSGAANINSIRITSPALINGQDFDYVLSKYQSCEFMFLNGNYVINSNCVNSINSVDNEYLFSYNFTTVIGKQEYDIVRNIPSDDHNDYLLFLDGIGYYDFKIDRTLKKIFFINPPILEQSCVLKFFISKNPKSLSSEFDTTIGETFYFNGGKNIPEISNNWSENINLGGLNLLNTQDYTLSDITKQTSITPLKRGFLIQYAPNGYLYFGTIAPTTNVVTLSQITAPPSGCSYGFIAEFGNEQLLAGGGHKTTGNDINSLYLGTRSGNNYTWKAIGKAPTEIGGLYPYNSIYVSLVDGRIVGFPNEGYSTYYDCSLHSIDDKGNVSSHWLKTPFPTPGFGLVSLEDNRILALGPLNEAYFGTPTEDNISWVKCHGATNICTSYPTMCRLYDGRILVTRPQNTRLPDPNWHYFIGTVYNNSIAWTQYQWPARQLQATLADAVYSISDNKVIEMAYAYDNLNVTQLTKPQIRVYDYYSAKTKIDKNVVPNIKYPQNNTIDVEFDPIITVEKLSSPGQCVQKIEVEVSRSEKFEYVEYTTGIIDWNGYEDFKTQPLLNIESVYYIRTRIYLNQSGWTSWKYIKITTGYADEIILKSEGSVIGYVVPTVIAGKCVSIDWGDGTFDNNIKTGISHTFTTENRTVIIRGAMTAVSFNRDNIGWINEIISINSNSLTSLANTFTYQTYLTKVPIKISCPNVTNFNSTWRYCSRLEEFNCDLNESINVTTLSYAWADCTKLKSFNSENIKLLVNITDLTYTWSNCKSMTAFNTTGLAGMTAVTNLSSTWYNTITLESFDTTPMALMDKVIRLTNTWGYSGIKTFDTTPLKTLVNTTNLAGTWTNCKNMKSFNSDGLSGMIKVTSLSSAWQNCVLLENFDTTPMKSMVKVTNLVSTWAGCSSLTDFDSSALEFLSLVSDLSNAWSKCSSLITFNTTGLAGMTAVTNLSSTWDGCSSLKSFDTTPFNFKLVTTASYTWQNCTNLINFNTTGLATLIVNGTFAAAWKGCTSLESFDTTPMSTSIKVTSLNYAWQDCTSLKTFDTTGISGMVSLVYLYCTWQSCTSLEDFDGAKMGELKKVTSLGNAWMKCSKLVSFDTSTWNLEMLPQTDPQTGQPAFSYTWSECGFTTFNATGIGTAVKLTSLSSYTWNKCTNLEYFDTTGWDKFVNLTTMSYLFNGCTNLKSFDASGLPVSLKTISYCFTACGFEIIDTTTFAHLINLTALTSNWNNCSDLVEFKPDGLTNLPKLTILNYMLSTNKTLTKIDFDKMPSAVVTNLTYACDGCVALSETDTTAWRAKVTANGKTKQTTYCFRGCTSLPDYAQIPSAWR